MISWRSSFFVSLAAVLLTAPVVHAGAARDLKRIEAEVRQSYPGAAQLAPDEFEKMKAAGTDVLVLDSREEDEFKVSHLPGAVRVPPAMPAATFAEQFGAGLRGKTIVVYCSVGVRSSKFVERVAQTAMENGAAKIYNLEGGIFRWHNEKRPLDSGSSSTDEVHPYSWSWGGYLERSDRAAYKPGETKPQ
jgi:rhodanese-related sulfurtransferase